jgi:hypothetical protein
VEARARMDGEDFIFMWKGGTYKVCGTSYPYLFHVVFQIAKRLVCTYQWFIEEVLVGK